MVMNKLSSNHPIVLSIIVITVAIFVSNIDVPFGGLYGAYACGVFIQKSICLFLLPLLKITGINGRTVFSKPASPRDLYLVWPLVLFILLNASYLLELTARVRSQLRRYFLLSHPIAGEHDLDIIIAKKRSGSKLH